MIKHDKIAFNKQIIHSLMIDSYDIYEKIRKKRQH